MKLPDWLPPGGSDPFEREQTFLMHELQEAHALNRALLRQLKKAQEAAAEASRAHAKMVATLTETMRQNTALTIERDIWKHRAEQSPRISDDAPAVSGVFPGIEPMTPAEARAIRKTMARLHHPDVGGDQERMKAWNMVLDQIEHRQER
ncbi:MAG: hypothetical protein HC884_02500 [Chloroflexaceae bacterium]|nr:hypothetical protein [Chloroflexaceae bacterium]